MRVSSKPWSGVPQGVAVIVVLGAVAVVLVVALVRGTADDPAVPAPGAGETSETSADGPAATNDPPGSEPSSGPTEVPEPGSLETVEVEEVRVARAVGFDEVGDFGTGVTVRVAEIEAVEGVARGPGQVSGPALRLTMEARNASDDPVSLEGMVVALAYGAAEAPAMRLSEPGEAPFEGELAPAEETVGVYVFAVPEESRSRVAVSASYTGSAPTVVFAGDAGRVSR